MVNENTQLLENTINKPYLITYAFGNKKMSGFEAESEIEENDNNLVLFDMRGSKKPQCWKFIKLIAPNNSKKKWKTTECNFYHQKLN